MTRSRLFALALLFICAFAGVHLAGDLSPQGRLTGVWQITSVEQDGKVAPAHVGSRLTFDGSKLHLDAWFPWVASDLGWLIVDANDIGQTVTYIAVDAATVQRHVDDAARG
ncbi:MAG: hypothetical protein FJ303_18130 [Planctomycetes bacterium]|nr:hypothetical protein [Planctomycetota bacterium]